RHQPLTSASALAARGLFRGPVPGFNVEGKNSMKIGFIGLGRMGNHMARHLAQKGHEVAAFDVRPEAVAEQAKIPGTRAATSVADAARDADVVFTSLPGPVEVEQIVSGEGGLICAMKPGSVYVDLSSNSPNL